MSTGLTQEIESTSLEDTLALAAKVGRNLKGGEVIELISDLGGGKTAFVRGLASGMGSKDRVSSPSFTLKNQYVAGDLILHHFDFYRLDEPGLIKHELAEILEDPRAVIAVEWAGLVEDILPAAKLTINIVPKDNESRELTMSYPDKLKYLLSENT